MSDDTFIIMCQGESSCGNNSINLLIISTSTFDFLQTSKNVVASVYLFIKERLKTPTVLLIMYLKIIIYNQIASFVKILM